MQPVDFNGEACVWAKRQRCVSSPPLRRLGTAAGDASPGNYITADFLGLDLRSAIFQTPHGVPLGWLRYYPDDSSLLPSSSNNAIVQYPVAAIAPGPSGAATTLHESATFDLPGVLLRGKYYTPEITKVKSHWKVPLNIHWTIPVQIHWTSDDPLGNTT